MAEADPTHTQTAADEDAAGAAQPAADAAD